MTIPRQLEGNNKCGRQGRTARLPYVIRFRIFLELKNGGKLEDTAAKYGLSRPGLGRWKMSGEFKAMEEEFNKRLFDTCGLPPEKQEKAIAYAMLEAHWNEAPEKEL